MGADRAAVIEATTAAIIETDLFRWITQHRQQASLRSDHPTEHLMIARLQRFAALDGLTHGISAGGIRLSLIRVQTTSARAIENIDPTIFFAVQLFELGDAGADEAVARAQHGVLTFEQMTEVIAKGLQLFEGLGLRDSHSDVQGQASDPQRESAPQISQLFLKFKEFARETFLVDGEAPLGDLATNAIDFFLIKGIFFASHASGLQALLGGDGHLDRHAHHLGHAFLHDLGLLRFGLLLACGGLRPSSDIRCLCGLGLKRYLIH